MLRRVIFNSSVMLAGQVIVKVLGLVWLAIIARHLGDARFGYLTYAFSLASLLGILIEFGFSSVITRAIARRPEESARYLSNVLSLRLGLSAIAIPLTVLVALHTGATRTTLTPVYVGAAATAVAGLYAISSSIFFGREKMEFPSMILVGSKLAAILVGLWVVHLGAGIAGIALVFLLEPVLNLLVSVPVLSRQFGLKFVPGLDFRFCRHLISEALPFALALALGLVYFKIDVVMLSAMKGSQCVGWYSAGYRLMEGLVYLPAAFVNTVFPTFSKLKNSSGDQLRTAVARSWEFVAAFALPTALGLILISDRIVLTLFGDGYLETIPVLRWIGAALFFVFINNLLGVLLGAIDRQKTHFYCSLLGVIVNVSLNLYLIPRQAHLGAAKATLITQVLLLVLLSVLAVRFTRVRLSGTRILKITFSGALMAGALLYWNELPLIAALALGAGVYLVGHFVPRAVTRENRREMRDAILPDRKRTLGST
ncbi:MAG: flippase [Candidatus Eisenbacteria sp.]|nr:flippase [Candidatus Eisenbacteria bacterium]